MKDERYYLIGFVFSEILELVFTALSLVWVFVSYSLLLQLLLLFIILYCLCVFSPWPGGSSWRAHIRWSIPEGMFLIIFVVVCLFVHLLVLCVYWCFTQCVAKVKNNDNEDIEINLSYNTDSQFVCFFWSNSIPINWSHSNFSMNSGEQFAAVSSVEQLPLFLCTMKLMNKVFYHLTNTSLWHLVMIAICIS